MTVLSDEEIAQRLTAIYFEEIARRGFKRKLDLDSVINTYLYIITRLQRKESICQKVEESVKRLEDDLSNETREELFPMGR
ncbi:MAG: hypothetical protein COT15_04705 [Candidatus Diapherotrites archaeon CG08_land_8_20_14_0_20_34_12]|nr:MAG: hypothetical protein COT15_04705 [Candidatus Diapherotrites archaeon CG08_land_8_20_14_0_20_34_12]